MKVPTLNILALLVLAATPLRGITEVGEREISQALNIAGGSEATRALFHAAYKIPVADASIELFEVVTEFRRFVLAAEDQLKAGNWMVARGGFDSKGRTLADVLRPMRGQASIRVRLRFHPLNNYSSPPAIDVLVGDPTLLAINAVRTPHVTKGEPPSRDVINGATVEAFFNAPTIDDRVLPVRVMFEGKELVRAPVDFSRVE